MANHSSNPTHLLALPALVAQMYFDLILQNEASKVKEAQAEHRDFHAAGGGWPGDQGGGRRETKLVAGRVPGPEWSSRQ